MTIRPPFAERAESRNAALDLTGIARVDRTHLHAEQLRCAPYGAENCDQARIAGVAEYSDAYHVRCNLPEEFKELPAQTVFINHEARRVTARVCHGLDEAGTDRVGDCREHDR